MSEKPNLIEYDGHELRVWMESDLTPWVIDTQAWVIVLLDPDGEPILAASMGVAAAIGQQLIETEKAWAFEQEEEAAEAEEWERLIEEMGLRETLKGLEDEQ